MKGCHYMPTFSDEKIKTIELQIDVESSGSKKFGIPELLSWNLEFQGFLQGGTIILVSFAKWNDWITSGGVAIWSKCWLTMNTTMTQNHKSSKS